MSKRGRITLLVLIFLMAIAIAAMLRYRGTVPVKLLPSQCDGGLWNRVYQNERLRMLEQCTAVEGRVASIERSSDGDLHIGLDPEEKSALNLINVIHGHGELVVEVVCEHDPVKDTAKAACAGFHSQVTIPEVGNRIRVTGAYVTDRDMGWNEIHPVTRIEVLP